MLVQVPAVHLCPGSCSALYCTGLDTGLVVDIGRREAHVMAVYRGNPILNSYAGEPRGGGAPRRFLSAGTFAMMPYGWEREGPTRFMDLGAASTSCTRVVGAASTHGFY